MESCIFSFYHGFFSEKSDNKCKTVQLDLQNNNCGNYTNNSLENFHPMTWNSPAEFLQFMQRYRFLWVFFCIIASAICHISKTSTPTVIHLLFVNFAQKMAQVESPRIISLARKSTRREPASQDIITQTTIVVLSLVLTHLDLGQTNHAGIFDFGIW